MILRWLANRYDRHRPKVFIDSDQVIGIDGKRRSSVPLVEIEAILDVAYENPGSFDTDVFCVLLLKERFFLIGVGTENGIGIMREIKLLRPELAVTSVWFEHIPWRLRARSCLGLRLFDLAGMGIFPLRYLPNYTLRKDKQIAIQAAIKKGAPHAQT